MLLPSTASIDDWAAARTGRPPLQALVIGASAGGVQALLQLLQAVPSAFSLPIVLLLHLPADRESGLVDVLRMRLGRNVQEAQDKQPIAAGVVYVAPPGYHLLIETDHSFSLSCDPPLHFSRPSIDVLFESAAVAYGAALAGFVLTGASHDGAAGLACIRQRGGLTVVQDPADAQVATMPEAAIRAHRPDFVLSLTDIQRLLPQLDTTP